MYLGAKRRYVNTLPFLFLYYGDLTVTGECAGGIRQYRHAFRGARRYTVQCGGYTAPICHVFLVGIQNDNNEYYFGPALYIGWGGNCRPGGK